jgi:nucleotide-binding universal stress UspA family protein
MMKILIPVDFTNESEVTYAFAAQLSQRHPTVAHLVHIYQLPVFPTTPFTGIDFYAPLLAEQEKLMTERLKHLSQSPHFVKCTVETTLVSDAIHGLGKEILQQAAKIQPDLIVCCTKHRSDTEQFLVGSELLRIIRQSTFPVLCLSEGHLPEVQSIVFSTDCSIESLPTLIRLMELATVLETDIHVVTVSSPSFFISTRDYFQRLTRFKEELGRTHPDHHLLIPNWILYNSQDIVSGIQQASEDMEADWLALATHGKSGISRLLDGSVTEQVVSESLMPVLSLRIGQ